MAEGADRDVDRVNHWSGREDSRLGNRAYRRSVKNRRIPPFFCVTEGVDHSRSTVKSTLKSTSVYISKSAFALASFGLARRTQAFEIWRKVPPEDR